MSGKKCEFIKKDGSQCQAYAVKGSKFCFFHSITEERRRELVEKRKKSSKNISLKSERGILKFLAKLIWDTYESEDTLSVERARVIATLLDKYERIKSAKEDKERRIKELEKEIEELRKELERR